MSFGDPNIVHQKYTELAKSPDFAAALRAAGGVDVSWTTRISEQKQATASSPQQPQRFAVAEAEGHNFAALVGAKPAGHSGGRGGVA